METEVQKLTYSVPEVAKVLGISKSNAYSLVQERIIPSVKLRGRVLVSRASVQALLSDSAKVTRAA